MPAPILSTTDSIPGDRPTLNYGDKLGGFEIEQRIGAGGIAEVYAARDVQGQREVALKTLRPKYSLVPEFVERMKQEAIITTNVLHRNVVKCWTAGVEDGRPWLALERLRGATLRQRLREGPLWPHDALALIRQAALGLHAAHRQEIVHRDIKPENLFIHGGQRLVVLDFGFAKTKCDPNAPDPFGPPGTIAYMAPEQINRKPAGRRTDGYSLGVCLYEALADHHPFTNQQDVWPSDDVIAAFHLEDPPYPLTELFEGFPTEIWSIVERCLRKDPAERYESVLEIATDLLKQERKLSFEYPRARFASASEVRRSWQRAAKSCSHSEHLREVSVRRAAPAGYLSAFIEPVFFIRWIAPQIADVARVVEKVRRAYAAFGKPMGYVAIVPEDCVPPDYDARLAMIRGRDQVLPYCEMMHIVMEGQGLRSALLRNAMATMLLFGRKSQKVRIYPTTAEALKALLPILPEELHFDPDATLAEARCAGLLSDPKVAAD